MYKTGTVYEARVEIGDKIYFKFSHKAKGKYVDIMRGDREGSWINYLLIPDVDLHYFVPDGTWILHTALECNPTWLFVEKKTTVKKGLTYTPTITRAKDGAKVSDVVYENSLGGKHYDAITHDDMAAAAVYSLKSEHMKEMFDRCEALRPIRQGIITNITEGGNKMLQLIDVIFFNRKTKKVDYRKEIVAVDIEEAFMLAAQEYGKFNSKIHARHASCIFSFSNVDDEE